LGYTLFRQFGIFAVRNFPEILSRIEIDRVQRSPRWRDRRITVFVEGLRVPGYLIFNERIFTINLSSAVGLRYLCVRLFIAKQKRHIVGFPLIGDPRESLPPTLSAGTGVRHRLPVVPSFVRKEGRGTAWQLPPAVLAVVGGTECSF